MKAEVYGVNTQGNMTRVGWVESEGDWEYGRYIFNEMQPDRPPYGVFWDNGNLAGILVPEGKWYCYVFASKGGRVARVGTVDDSMYEFETQDTVERLAMYVSSSGLNYREFENEVGLVHSNGRVDGRYRPTGAWTGDRMPIGLIRPPIDIRIMAGAALVLLCLG